MKTVAALLALCASGIAQAQGIATTQAEAGYTHEALSGNRADWESVYVELFHRRPDRTAVTGLLRRTSRFDQHDNEVGLGVSVAAASCWTLGVDGTMSDTYRVLPRGSLGVNAACAFDGGYVLGIGLKRTEYRHDDTWLASITGERYWDNFRAALTLYAAQLNNGARAGSQRFAFDFFYADRSRLGLSGARGRELENDGSGGVIAADVKSIALAGSHWINLQWAVAWELGWHEQGELYRRTGIRVGLRREF